MSASPRFSVGANIEFKVGNGYGAAVVVAVDTDVTPHAYTIRGPKGVDFSRKETSLRAKA